MSIRYRTLFPYKLGPMPKAYFNVKNPKFGPLLRTSEAEKKKMATTPSFLGQKIKCGVILYEKSNGFFDVQ